MKALSIRPPWAGLVAHGVKTVEVRFWRSPVKLELPQRIAIHASKTVHYPAVTHLYERHRETLDCKPLALPRGALAAAETRVERERARAGGLDARRCHAALAARLLAASPKEAAALLRRARAGVDRWERDGLCSAHYITRWRERLTGSPRRAALALLEFDAWTDALLQNTPWSFALALPKP